MRLLNINRAIKPLLMLLVLAGIQTQCAWAADYPPDMIKKYPKSFHAFQKLIPARWAKIPWVHDLEGTGIPVQSLDFEGKKFMLGRVCRPHDCAGNDVTFLLSEDGATAYARVNSVLLTKGKDEVFGKPSAAALKLLVNGPN
jgi:hypothetical protein